MFFLFLFCVWMGKGKPLLHVLGNCSNKDPCHMWVGSLVKWWTTNKTNIKCQINKTRFFQVAHSIKHLVWVHPPHVMPKLKRDANFVNLIWVSKVFYAKGFTNVWDSQNWTKFSSKKNVKKRSFYFWITMNWKWINLKKKNQEKRYPWGF